jgi:fermentation-respiration switch protein FrsA (DUF1100 family)
MTLRWLVLVLALVAVATGGWRLHDASRGLGVTPLAVGSTPATVFRRAEAGPAPVVVIAHGFAGSQQLMQPFAVTLARAGYVAVTFDAAGHGRNGGALRGGIGDGAITTQLVEETARVVAAARQLPGSDGRIALLGHSMASDIVIRAAQALPDVAATVAVSAFAPTVRGDSPRNLLVIVGALEPAMLQREGERMLRQSAGPQAIAGITYGDPAGGTARRLELAPGVEHIGVLYAPASLRAARDWLDASFGRHTDGAVDARGLSLALLLGGLVALAFPLTTLLPRMAPACEPPRGRWRDLLVLAVAPAVATPLLLWPAPIGLLPVLLADYLALHFLVYGLLTAFGLWWLRRRGQPIGWSLPAPWSLAFAVLALVLYDLGAIGQAIDRFAFAFMPVAQRVPLIAVLACATLPFFVADEWLTRAACVHRGSYALTKLCFLVSLAFAIALAPAKLFFLVIIAPAILLLFIAFGLISRWAHAATGHFLPGAIANAFVFAWAIGVTFPLIARG